MLKSNHSMLVYATDRSCRSHMFLTN